MVSEGEDEEKDQEKKNIFHDVNYYVIGAISDEALEMLEKGGAHEESYLMDRVTHVITEEVDNPEIGEARDFFELPIVSPKWIELSLKCGGLLPTKAFDPETTTLFSGISASFSRVPRMDRDALWAMLTFYGGQCEVSFSKTCTHLVTPHAAGPKYECAMLHTESVKVVSPDWLLDCVQSKCLLDEKPYHPKYILSEDEIAAQEWAKRKEEEKQMERDGEAMDVQEESKPKGPPKPQYKVRAPWEITPMPELPPMEQLPPLDPSPSPGSTATTSTTTTPPKRPDTPSKGSTTPSKGPETPSKSSEGSSKKKDKKHKKKKKKKKHKKNKEKKKDKKKGRSSGNSTPRSEVSISESSMDPDKGTPRSMLRNITNSTDFIPMIQSGNEKRHISQVLNALGGGKPQQKGRSLGPHFGVIPSIPTVQYYGHDPACTVKADYCLLGCIFLIMEYPQLVGAECIDTWVKVIQQHGGIVDECYSDRVTHILCDTQKTEVFQLARKDGKRCITACWLNDCLREKSMKPPWRALHFPPLSYPLYPPLCKDYVVAVTGFEGPERNDIKTMIELTGASYTGHFSRGNTLLICRTLEGQKYEKAQEWRIPAVNVRWLSDIILGKFDAIQNMMTSRYQTYDITDPFKIEYDIPLPLMAPWTQPLKISPAMKRSFAHLNGKRKMEQQLSPGHSKRAKKSNPIDDEVWETPPKTLEPSKVPKVMFTGIDQQFLPDLSKKLEKLGGKVVTDIKKCTHLVTTKILRTVKFLGGICVCRHILSPMWIEESYKSRWFLDEANFAILDPETEALFSFKLAEAIQTARQRKIFHNTVLYITSNVHPSYNTLKDIVECGGGKIIPKRPSLHLIQQTHKKNGPECFVTISCEQDLPVCRDLFRNNIDVHNVEFILTGVLRQQLDYKSYDPV